MTSEQPEPQQTAPDGERPSEVLRRRRRRRRQVGLLGGVAAFWVAMGLALYVVEWPTDAGSDVPHSGGSWEEIRGAPLNERLGTAVTWADDRLVVFGGYAPDGAGEAPVDFRTDGAVWSPSGEWREMASPPDGLTLAADGFAVWTGEEAVFGPAVPADPADAQPVAAADASDGEGSADGAGQDDGSDVPGSDVPGSGVPGSEGAAERAVGLLGYDPDADSWRSIELSGVELTTWRVPGHGYTSHQVGEELVLARPAAGSEAPEVVALDPASGEGRALPPGPYAPENAEGDGDADGDRDGGSDGAHVVHLTGTDDHLVATAEGGTDTWVLDLADPAAEWAPGTPSPTTGTLRDGLGADDLVLYLTQDEPLAYDVADDSWRALSDAPVAPRELDTGYVWTGDAALAAGQVYEPGGDVWAEVSGLPVEDEDVISGPHTEWTGDAMVVFGGQFVSPCPADTICEPDPLHPDDLRGWVYVR